MPNRLAITLLLLAAWAGCGTTKWTDTARTATEQLLISDSIDRAISHLDLRAIAGKKVYLDDTYVKHVTDTAYLVSSLRQHILGSGAILKDKRDEADYIVEVRAGAVGTDRHDVLFGVPQTTIPSLIPFASLPSTTIPEIPLVKRTEQQAVTKIAVFAYNRHTGRPIWQSGIVPFESKARAVWVFGAGPFQRGHIYQGTNFAGGRLNIPFIDPAGLLSGDYPPVSIAEEAYYGEPREETARRDAPQNEKAQARPSAQGSSPQAPSGVVQASHSGPAGQAAVPAGPQAKPPPEATKPHSSSPHAPDPAGKLPPGMPQAVTPLPEVAPSVSTMSALSGNPELLYPHTDAPWPWPDRSGEAQSFGPGFGAPGAVEPHLMVDPMPNWRR